MSGLDEDAPPLMMTASLEDSRGLRVPADTTTLTPGMHVVLRSTCTRAEDTNGPATGSQYSMLNGSTGAQIILLWLMPQQKQVAATILVAPLEYSALSTP